MLGVNELHNYGKSGGSMVINYEETQAAIIVTFIIIDFLALHFSFVIKVVKNTAKLETLCSDTRYSDCNSPTCR